MFEYIKYSKYKLEFDVDDLSYNFVLSNLIHGHSCPLQLVFLFVRVDEDGRCYGQLVLQR
jgi:hypothetical protein